MGERDKLGAWPAGEVVQVDAAVHLPVGRPDRGAHRVHAVLAVSAGVDDAPGELDELEILVEVEERIFSDEVKTMQTLGDKIKREISSILGISARVKLVEPKTIERSEGKAKRVVDKRKL